MKIKIIEEAPKYSIREDGCVLNIKTGRILKPSIVGKYLSVGISNDEKIRICRSVHRLLAIAFIPNPNNYSQVNHKDGDKFNNSLSNLEWCSPSQNVKHAYDNGLRIIGDKHRESARKHALSRRKTVVNTETGVHYNGLKEAIASLPKPVSEKYLSMQLRGRNRNLSPFMYLDDLMDIK